MKTNKVTPGRVTRCQRKLALLTRDMKLLAAQYKIHQNNKDFDAASLILCELKEKTAEKKLLTVELDDLISHLYDGIELETGQE